MMVRERMRQKIKDPSPKKIAAATALALVAATAVLLVAVLPAEYGLDPLGTGKSLGLLALAKVRPITPQPEEYRLDSVELGVNPSEWVEYSYRLEDSGSMLFSWQATGPVHYNFHSQPDGSPPGYAESFDQQETDQAHGTYAAPFSGIHGWYWENRGATEITITLTTAGFYSRARESRDRISGFHELTDPRGNVIKDLNP